MNALTRNPAFCRATSAEAISGIIPRHAAVPWNPARHGNVFHPPASPFYWDLPCILRRTLTRHREPRSAKPPLADHDRKADRDTDNIVQTLPIMMHASLWCPRPDSNRHGLRPRDFKSPMSTIPPRGHAAFVRRLRGPFKGLQADRTPPRRVTRRVAPARRPPPLLPASPRRSMFPPHEAGSR